MRTTISIEDSLLEKAKQVALSRSCTLSDVVEDALRQAIAALPKLNGPALVRPLLTFQGTGVRPGVGLNSTESLLEVMEGR